MMYKRKIIIAISFLLICLILLISVSYAWLSLSVTPEISGIDTHIGANGSLEIALVSESTYYDPSLIRTVVGGSSVVLDPKRSNLYWGSVIDLTDDSYGLNKISILPSRLNVYSSENGNAVVGSNILVIPDYNADGRFDEFVEDTVTASYQDSWFLYSAEQPSYGVRGIGTVSDFSVHLSSLANARSLVKSYTTASVNATTSAWKENGDAILRIYCDHYINGSNSFSADDIAALKEMAVQMQNAVNFIELALRQGAVGYASVAIENADDFKEVRSMLENTYIPLSTLTSYVSIELPGSYSQWIKIVENDKKQMQAVISSCNSMSGNSFTWEQVSPLVNALLKEDQAYLEKTKLSDMKASTRLEEDNILSITPQAGIMADVAAFSGNYSTFFNYLDSISVEVGTTSGVATPHLEALSNALDKLQVSPEEETYIYTPLNQVYGYAIDMAFRCNQGSNLLLQTIPAQRLGDDNDAQAQGNGSFMRFTSEELSVSDMVKLMDAIRVGFMDQQNNLLGIAKLNTSNYAETDDGVIASLYMYDYEISASGNIVMGERIKDEGAITELPQNTPVVLTIVVWLDGDYVDNSISAITAQSMTGVLNLQFSSSAELNPADYPLN